MPLVMAVIQCGSLAVAVACANRPTDRCNLFTDFSRRVSYSHPRNARPVILKAKATSGLRDLLPFLKKGDKQAVKEELLVAIEPLERGAASAEEDRIRIDKIAKKLEELNPTKQPLKSSLVNGKWELLYTTSQSILKTNRPKLLRPIGPIYQAINVDTLRAQNLETWPFFNQVTANLTPLNSKRVVVNFDYFKIAGLIRIKAPGRARGELEITYLDDDLRVSRGDRGNLFILKMVDRDYRVPTPP